MSIGILSMNSKHISIQNQHKTLLSMLLGIFLCLNNSFSVIKLENV